MPYMGDSYLSAGKDLNEVDVGSRYYADTALRLNSHCVVGPNICNFGASKRKWNDESLILKNGISLALELGSSQSSLEIQTRSASAETALTSGINVEEEPLTDICLGFNLNLGSKRACKEVSNKSSSFGAPVKERPNIDLGLSLSSGTTESDVTSVTQASLPIQNGVEVPASLDIIQLVDDGSTSSKWKRGPLLPLPDRLQTTQAVMPREGHSNNVSPISAVSNLSSVHIPVTNSSLDGAGTSRSKPPRRASVKTCQFPGCEKGARGASGRCISHGGGRRCQRLGCPKGAEGRTAFCKAHGGGRRCEHLGCTKSAEGRTNLCIAHGGGRRCSFNGGCTRAARGKSGLCIRHGGGKRCKIENCTKSAEGLSGLCIAHGGGRRCQFPQCTKGAQGSTKFCKAHGGGKRCTFLGCTKGAEGSTPFCKGHGGGKRCSFQGGGVCTKSVHGGTLFCVSHGGGKRCAVDGCTKSARGRTNFCVRHGGGKRCKHDGCGKSAQGSTDFCKAHGGGKRCLWGQPGSGFGGDTDPACDKFARGKIGLCAAHAAQVHDKRVHGDGTVGLKMKEVVTDNRLAYPNTVAEERPTFWSGFDYARNEHHSMPMQTVLPQESFFVGQCSASSALASLPEGRVHGGSLMAMLRGGASSIEPGANQLYK